MKSYFTSKNMDMFSYFVILYVPSPASPQIGKKTPCLQLGKEYILLGLRGREMQVCLADSSGARVGASVEPALPRLRYTCRVPSRT
jgi:hypothetical protein